MNLEAELPIPAPFEDRLTVKPEWLDLNGHMNVAFYLRAVDDGSNAFFDALGLGWDYTEAGAGSIFVTSCNMDFKRELFAGDALLVTSQLLDWSAKLIHCYAEVFNTRENYLAATCESIYMHIAFATRRSAPMPEHAQQQLAKIQLVHAARLARPTNLNRPLEIRR
jgi:acyl-CoA thioester hydrolase